VFTQLVGKVEAANVTQLQNEQGGQGLGDRPDAVLRVDIWRCHVTLAHSSAMSAGPHQLTVSNQARHQRGQSRC